MWGVKIFGHIHMWYAVEVVILSLEVRTTSQIDVAGIVLGNYYPAW